MPFPPKKSDPQPKNDKPALKKKVSEGKGKDNKLAAILQGLRSAK